MAEIRDIKSTRSGAPSGEPTPRRLAAIVAGDIAGYSRLMQIDEEGTHNRVKRIERDLVQPSIAEHHGRLVKTTGDGFIAIFDSPVEAVRCGIVIQQNMVGRNASLPKHHWIEYRIGVNLGDVIIEPDDVYGDGVNIASRLEGIADPGQVYISGGIYEQIKHKLVCGYESLGDRKIKNITDPVRVYRVLPDPAAFQKVRKRRENILIFLLSITLLVIAGGVLWYMLLQPYQLAKQKQASAPVPSRSEIPGAPVLPKSPVKPAEPQRQPDAAPPASQQAAPSPSPHSFGCAIPPTGGAGTCGRAPRHVRPAVGFERAGARDESDFRRPLYDGQQRGHHGKADSPRDDQAVLDRSVSDHRSRMERMRCRKGMHIRGVRQRRCARHKCKLERCQAICRLACGCNGKVIPASERS